MATAGGSTCLNRPRAEGDNRTFDFIVGTGGTATNQ